MKDAQPGIEFRTCSDNRLAPACRLAALPFAALWTIVFLFLGGLTATAQVSREYQLKAVFLYNFAQFTEWPATAFADDKAPIIIGIVGADPFGSTLDDTVRGETVGGHPLVIEHYAHPADIKPCQMLFISQSEIRHTDEILKSIKEKPELTVADTENAATSGVMIRFIVESNKVHFRINADAARAAHLSLSSRLLSVADVAPANGKVLP